MGGKCNLFKENIDIEYEAHDNAKEIICFWDLLASKLFVPCPKEVDLPKRLD